MDILTGRANYIEDVLVRLHTGQWFGWSDSKNKVYENLVIHDDSKEKPTQEFLESELQRMQDEFDALDYARDRSEAYPSMEDQLDYIYHNGIAKWKSDMVKPVKDAHPKP